MADAQVFVVGGIAFADMEQAKLAQSELKRIEVLDSRLDYKNKSAVAMVYEKSLANQIFKTPIGISYMLRLQKALVQLGYEEIADKPIALPQQAGNASQPRQQKVQEPQRESVWKSRLDAQREREAALRRKYRLSQLGNLFLAILVLALFLISQTGKNPTILNYKSKILNQYTAWEQELDEREQQVREKEAELGISAP